MFIGRAAVITLAAKRRKNKLEDPLYSKKNGPLHIFQKKFIEQQSDKTMLSFRQYPKAGWFIGLIMIIGSVVMFYIWINYFDLFFIQQEITFFNKTYKILIMCLTLVLGLMFLFASKIVTTQIDKNSQQITVRSTNIFCNRQLEKRSIQQITDISIIKRGHDGIQVNTIHYIIQILFKDEWCLDILETTNCYTAKKYFVKVMTFLDRNINFDENIKIIDQSTGKKPKTKATSNNQQQDSTNLIPAVISDSKSATLSETQSDLPNSEYEHSEFFNSKID